MQPSIYYHQQPQQQQQAYLLTQQQQVAAAIAASQQQQQQRSSSLQINQQNGLEGEDDDDDGNSKPESSKKSGRRKIKIEYIEDKSRRHITFSKRKAGIMKKAYELSTLTGTQVLLLVVSETGLVYTFTTPKLQPLVTKPEGKNLIQSCLNAPEEPQAESSSSNNKTSSSSSSSSSTTTDNTRAYGGLASAAYPPSTSFPRLSYPQDTGVPR